jgi:hypothetical protein
MAPRHSPCEHVGMHAFRWNTALLSVALCAVFASHAAAGDDKAKANDVTAGFNAAPQSLYWYGEVDRALNGDMDKTGYVLRSYSSIAAYSYTNPLNSLGEVNGRFYQSDFMVGYQVVRDGVTVSGYAGFDYQDAQLSPNDPTSRVNGTRTGAKVAANIAYDDEKQPVTGSLSTEYSSAYDTYYAQLRVGLRVCKKLVVGPEAEADGDTGYNGQTLGGYATYTVDVTKDQSFDVTIAGGHQFVDGTGSTGVATGFAGSSGPYGTIEVNTSF